MQRESFQTIVRCISVEFRTYKSIRVIVNPSFEMSLFFLRFSLFGSSSWVANDWRRLAPTQDFTLLHTISFSSAGFGLLNPVRKDPVSVKVS